MPATMNPAPIASMWNDPETRKSPMNGSHSQIRKRRPDRTLPEVLMTGMPQPANQIAAAR